MLKSCLEDETVQHSTFIITQPQMFKSPLGSEGMDALLKTHALVLKGEVPYVYLQSVQVNQVSAHVNAFRGKYMQYCCAYCSSASEFSYFTDKDVLKMKLRHLWF